MNFLIVTGMSGAGKSSVKKFLEDIGYYCIDNMPPALMLPFAQVCSRSDIKIDKIAFVTDLRGGNLFNELFKTLDAIKKAGFTYEILFLDASTKTLVHRYKETRRTHPLSAGDTITDGINKERMLLSDVRKIADNIIDTTSLSPSQLREELCSIYSKGNKYKGIVIDIISFGFKNGIPMDVDLVFDVRFLPNPFYIDELKHKSGLDKEVRDYVTSFPQTIEFEKKLQDMISFLIPYYIEEGKNQLIISIGCTGGKHRSVTIAERLGEFLKSKNYRTVIEHRDYKNE